MILHPPFAISARLLPSLKIGEAWLSWDDGEFVLDTPDFEYVIDDFHPGCGGGIPDYFEAILGFMEAAAESRQYRERNGRPGENEDLFPPHVVDWIVDNLDEIACLEYAIQASEKELIEE